MEIKIRSLERWDEIFASAEGDVAAPLPFVIDELDRIKVGGRALDLGCGAGRHCRLLARRGFETHGLDLSFMALRKTASNLQTRGVTHLKQGEIQELPYSDGVFDLVVSVNVIHHNDAEGALKSASEIRRVLKSGGYLIATIAATSHHNFGKGRKVDEKTFIRQSGVETGILHYFMEEKDVRESFRGFQFEYLNEELGSCFFSETIGQKNYHWFLTARKT